MLSHKFYRSVNHIKITLRSEDAALAISESGDDVFHENALLCAGLELANELVCKVGKLLDSAL